MIPHGPWQIIRRQTVYQDPWMHVQRDDVIRPDGQLGTYSVVHIKAGVCVLALDDHGQVYLTEEFHYGVGRSTMEGVSGGIEPGEDALHAAQRELREELGIEARDWLALGMVDPFTASAASPTQLLLARDLEIGEPNLEGTELIRRVQMPLSEAVQMVMDSQITHGPSCVLILKTHRILASKAP